MRAPSDEAKVQQPLPDDASGLSYGVRTKKIKRLRDVSNDHDAKERAELLSVNHDSASFATGYCVA
jgi:hypothetical protein